MNVREHNRNAWDREVERANEWTVPVSSELIAAGIAITGFYEDRHRCHPLANFMPTYIATRAIKP